jgi:carboxypeptidase Taq
MAMGDKGSRLLARLREYSRELTDLQHIMALLQWDQETMLPEGGAEERARQTALLSGVIHRRQVAPRLGRLLAEAEERQEGFSENGQALLRVMRREYDQSVRLPAAFVTSFSRLTSQALAVWSRARRTADFRLFAPLLTEIVAQSRRKAEYLGYGEEPYDALLDLHEEGLSTARVGGMFAGLRAPLTELVRTLRERGEPLSFAAPFAQERQRAFAGELLAAMGFDFSRGRQDVSAHPFSTSLGSDDHRITNRYRPESLEFIFTALHEGGHALYEQNIGEELSGTALAGGVSLGIHESQSRLWENIIGRGLPFWRHFYPRLRRAFPRQFRGLPVEDFVAGLNLVRPGPIRVEADEVSYNLHVLVRFELEKALLDGALAVADLPAAWNEKYRDCLGVRVESAALGVLQDVHWAHGSLGYFPTYTIGNLVAAQIWESYCAAEPQADRAIARGDLRGIRAWLGREIHCHGSIHPPAALVLRATGRPLAADAFLAYLRRKYDAGQLQEERGPQACQPPAGAGMGGQ